MLPADQTVADDTCAITAAFFEQDAGTGYLFYLTRRRYLIGWPTFFKLQAILTNKTKRIDRPEFVNAFLAQSNIVPVEFTREYCFAAARAMVRYCKGDGNNAKPDSAKLNYGDCRACAVAKIVSVALISKGDDLIHTNINDASK